MKKSTIEILKSNMEPRKYYSRKEICKILCPTQSTTAEYILQDVIACGYLQENINGYFRINQ